MVRAVAAARGSLGHVGFAPANGAAIGRAGICGARIRARAAGGDCGPIERVLEVAGTDVALVVEPSVDGRNLLTALKTAGVHRLWIARSAVDGPGRFVAEARRAGFAVRHVDHPARADLHAAYDHAVRTGRAYVVAKVASSLDGRIATRTGESQWITGPCARAAGRRLRAQLDTILVGVQTVLSDDPQLTARRAGAHDPLRAVLDSRLRTPVGSRLVQSARQVPVVVFTVAGAPAVARRALEVHGVRVVTVSDDAAGRVDVSAVARWLADDGRAGLLVEGGGAVHGAFFDAGLVDRVVWFTAPLVLGGEGRAAVSGRGPDVLRNAARFSDWKVRRVGPDWRLDARRGPGPIEVDRPRGHPQL